MNTTDYMTSELKVVHVINSNLEQLKLENVVSCNEHKKQSQLLVGADYFFELVLKIKALRPGFYLLLTLVGPVLTGKGYRTTEEALGMNSSNFQ